MTTHNAPLIFSAEDQTQLDIQRNTFDLNRLLLRTLIFFSAFFDILGAITFFSAMFVGAFYLVAVGLASVTLCTLSIVFGCIQLEALNHRNTL